MTATAARLWLALAIAFLASSVALGQSVAKPLPPSRLCADQSCVTAAAGATAIGAVKWHPGWYIRIGPDLYPTTNASNRNPSTLSQILAFMDSIKNEPIKGVLVAGFWSQWEGSTAGDYSAGFGTVDAILAKAAANGQHVMLDFWAASFGSSSGDWSTVFPAYLVQPANGGTDVAGRYGITPMTGNIGLQARIWQSATADRLIALYKAYAARYDTHPNLEMVSLGETSINVALGTDGYTRDSIDAQLRRQLSEIRAVWPTTQLRLNANWYLSQQGMVSLVNYAGQLALAIGGPDTMPMNPTWAQQAFTGSLPGAIDWRGRVPFVSEVQDPELGGKAGTYTNEQIYLAAMQGISSESGGATGSGSVKFAAVQPQYWVWYMNTWSGGPEQQWSTGTLPFIRSINGAVFSTSCPQAYSKGCATR